MTNAQISPDLYPSVEEIFLVNRKQREGHLPPTSASHAQSKIRNSRKTCLYSIFISQQFLEYFCICHLCYVYELNNSIFLQTFIVYNYYALKLYNIRFKKSSWMFSNESKSDQVILKNSYLWKINVTV